ncbi:hypothetical protein ABZ622_37580 [Streptomyces sp. NPDC007164]|uniref:hypothetical protein n=1 Tax=Streptomyces sp. NPDC007164 TaxID=3156918 RepID=UPI00340FC29A
MAALAVVRDLREHWAPASAEELERFETDALSGFVLARASAGLADGTIRGDVGHLDQIRTWFGRPLLWRFFRRPYPWWAWAFLIAPAIVAGLAKATYWSWRLWDYAQQATGPWC